jgi:hypothetical protein
MNASGRFNCSALFPCETAFGRENGQHTGWVPNADLDMAKGTGKVVPVRILFLRDASCCAKLLQFLYMPAIATEVFFYLLQSFTTKCFRPCGPSSSGI